MKMFRYSLIAFVAFISLTSCKKDNNSKTELLTDRNWKLVSSMSKIGNGAWSEEISSYSACELDNYIDFRTNNTYESNEGATKCDRADPQSETGSWSFLDNETKLVVDGETLTLDELSNNTLSVSESETFQGITYYYKQTFTH